MFHFQSVLPPQSCGTRLGTEPKAAIGFPAVIRAGREVVGRAEVKTGLRALELRRAPDQWGKSFEFVVNGIEVFSKGADVIPFDSFPNRVTPQIHRKILQDARDAHMNM